MERRFAFPRMLSPRRVVIPTPVQINSPNRHSRRVVSLDSSAYQNVQNLSINNVDGTGRSLSAGDPTGVMNRLEFENIDLLNTPLSSLRSCSEYNKVNPDPNQSNYEELP